MSAEIKTAGTSRFPSLGAFPPLHLLLAGFLVPLHLSPPFIPLRLLTGAIAEPRAPEVVESIPKPSRCWWEHDANLRCALLDGSRAAAALWLADSATRRVEVQRRTVVRSSSSS